MRWPHRPPGLRWPARAPRVHWPFAWVDVAWVAFSLAELLARVRVRLRGEVHSGGELLKVGDLILHVGRLEANIGHGPVALTRLEFLLLRELMEHAGHSVGKGQLLASVWGYDFDPGSNVVDVCVRRLRSKLGFELIETVRGEGYRLAS